MPTVHFRSHDAEVSTPLPLPFHLSARDDRYELSAVGDLPSLRLKLQGERSAFTHEPKTVGELVFHIEKGRGYASVGTLWSPGYFRVDLVPQGAVALVASTESWESIQALTPAAAWQAERERRRRLIAQAHPALQNGDGSQLVLAADQFLIRPATRVADAARAHAAGDEVRTVIAGYHWFTDWGRDTMISLEGLTLTTGRFAEAGYILRTFAALRSRRPDSQSVSRRARTKGSITRPTPRCGIFHALDRYLHATGDRDTLRCVCCRRCIEIVEHHLRGTRFGIGVDPADGLLRQGAEGLSAHLDGCQGRRLGRHAPPRQGRRDQCPVVQRPAAARRLGSRGSSRLASRRQSPRTPSRRTGSFNRTLLVRGRRLFVRRRRRRRRTTIPPAGRISCSRFRCRHPVLDAERWQPVLDVVREQLLTPVGLRTLAPGHPDYKPTYDGDLRARDAAYHQGTVWAWLIGPFIDAWLKVHPDQTSEAHGIPGRISTTHLDEACVGSISEVFDAEAPYTPRGCIAQAWSVAEVLRSLALVAASPSPTGS